MMAITGFDESQTRAALADTGRPIPAGADFYWSS
jgi:hypothetical protein